MAARQAAHERRAAARAKRRERDSEPQAEERAAPSDTAETIWEAASAAIVGAAVGAAQALARQREEARAGEEQDEAMVPEAETQEPGSENPVPGFEPEAETQEPGSTNVVPEFEPEPEPEPTSEPGRPGDAGRMVRRARRQLQELRGVEPESVSGVARTANGWRVSLEVVEVHRIPESTDVLATYQLELDADGELLTFERTHRYYRSEADRR